MKIGREFYFDAAHFLPRYKGKCERFHGHTYKLEVIIDGEIQKNGMVLDFNDLNKIVNEKILNFLDHRNLNEIFKQPTAERIAEWIFSKLKKELPCLYSVKLWEGKGKWVLIEK
ncbi:MAG: 6-carboxytetrahydropterin synthase QueD [Candidatus Altiarchaeota archaeon]